MNAHVRQDPIKHKFTCEDFTRLWNEGYFPTYPKLELIEGELFEMPDDGFKTINWNAAVNEWLVSTLVGSPYRVVVDKTLRTTTHNAPKPDFWIYPRAMPLSQVRAKDALLAIEVADTSMHWDTVVKPPIYEKGALRDYWVIDCNARRVLVFRPDAEGRYGAPASVDADQPLAALAVPGLILRLESLALASE